ncbi:cation transporter, partial [Pseudomonas aeruginosa]|nr:cation transporter [Pseudomonas aeruginosa]
ELLDLHLWQVGQGKYACLQSLLTTEEGSADYFKRRLAEHEELVHITVEVNPLLPLAA